MNSFIYVVKSCVNTSSPFIAQCSKRCAFGGECVFGQGIVEECVCPSCPSSHVYTPVCGTNGRSYATECHMKKDACQSKMDITVAKREPCGMLLLYAY